MNKKLEDINKNIYFLNKEFYKQQLTKNLNDYTKDKFFKDLGKVCRPVKKSDKQQPSSCKT